MLLDEARAMACFDHPNVVSVLDVGEHENGLYLALEYVEGTDLRRVNNQLRARKEALPFELAAFVTAEVLRGLHHAHNAHDPDGHNLEIVHRDVNPSNVLVSTAGHVKLTDFGVVRMRERLQQKTQPGLIKGKYAYLAPEYIAGESCTRQTDIYAAGIMLFELLSGRECFTGESAYEVMWKIVNRGIPRHRLEREHVPEDLKRIVERATNTVPERRYESAQDMANALEAWLVHSGRQATPWVVSVFFTRHDLYDSPDGTRPSTLPLENATDALDIDKEPEIPITTDDDEPTRAPRTVSPVVTPAPPSFSLPLTPGSGEQAATDRTMPTELGGEPELKPMVSGPQVLNSDDIEIANQNTLLPRVDGQNTPPPPEPLSPPEDEVEGPGATEVEWDILRSVNKENDVHGTKTAPSVSAPWNPDPLVEEDPSAAKTVIQLEADSEPPKQRKRLASASEFQGEAVWTGELDQIPAVDVLERLGELGTSGVLKFRCGLIWKSLEIEDGRPISITSNMGMELIGEHLVKARVISRRNLDRALREAKEESKRLTHKLIELGLLDRSTLEKELGENLSSRLDEVLEWRWGAFEFSPQAVESAEILPQLDFSALIERARAALNREDLRAGRKPESGESTPEARLEEALEVARSIAESSGKGRIDEISPKR